MKYHSVEDHSGECQECCFWGSANCVEVAHKNGLKSCVDHIHKKNQSSATESVIKELETIRTAIETIIKGMQNG